jgi:hypothetical protein
MEKLAQHNEVITRLTADGAAKNPGPDVNLEVFEAAGASTLAQQLTRHRSGIRWGHPGIT